jgi:2,3-dimethylmalate lyase
MRPGMSTRLRELLAGQQTLVKPGVYNALSAKMVEQAGFKILGVSGYACSATLLGRPDIGLTTLTEVVMLSRYIVDAVSIPVIADADTGFGNAINVMRSIEDFIGAGVAAVHIEDQVAPKRCGHIAGKRVIPLDEAVGKYRAADKVRRELDPNFVIIARCDARGTAGGSIDAVIERSNAYLDAGADMIFPEAVSTEEELERCVREIRGPIHYNRSGISPKIPLQRLQELGVAIVSNPDAALESSVLAMWDYLHAFAAEDVTFLERFWARAADHPAGDLNRFIGFAEVRRLEEEFLPPEEVETKYAGSLGFMPD